MMKVYSSWDKMMEAGAGVSQWKMYPWFDIAHFALSCMTVRDDLSKGANLFSRKHPLSCWFSSMLLCFAGSIIANLLVGESLLTPFKANEKVALASLIWYIVFYSPFDIAVTLAKIFPIRCCLATMKEIRRAHTVFNGVHVASRAMPNAWLVMIIVGTVKGSGSGLMRTFEQLMRGIWIPTGNEILRPSFTTKASILMSCVFVLNRVPSWISHVPHEIIFLSVATFFVYFKMSAIVLGVHDPFKPMENLFCSLFMGGIWDAASRAFADTKSMKNNKNNHKNNISNNDSKSTTTTTNNNVPTVPNAQQSSMEQKKDR